MSEALARDLPSNHDTSAPEKNTPIEAPATYAVLWNREAAAEALNERRIDLRLSMIELDETANQAAGTSAKYLSPGQTKCLGVESLFRLAGALGLRVVLEVDPKATAALLEQSRPRRANQVRLENFSQKCGRRTLDRALRHMAACYSWREIIAAASGARATVAAEQATKAAAQAATKQKSRARAAIPVPLTSAAAAYDGGMVTAMGEIEGFAEATSIRVSSRAGDRRGAKRGKQSGWLFSPDPRTKIRRTQSAYLSRRAKTLAV